jgi:hypothetical protein
VFRKQEKKGNTNKKVMKGLWGVVLLSSFLVVFGLEELGGGGGSVRRRNTLHVVGGRQLSLSQARFTGRENI